MQLDDLKPNERSAEYIGVLGRRTSAHLHACYALRACRRLTPAGPCGLAAASRQDGPWPAAGSIPRVVHHRADGRGAGAAGAWRHRPGQRAAHGTRRLARRLPRRRVTPAAVHHARRRGDGAVCWQGRPAAQASDRHVCGPAAALQ
eukprot:360147-Chlamydomonas_euryale.AAC.13